MSNSIIEYLNWNQIDNDWSSSANDWTWDSVYILITTGVGKPASVTDDDPYNQYEYNQFNQDDDYNRKNNNRNVLIEFYYNNNKKTYRKTLSPNIKLILTEAKIKENEKDISVEFGFYCPTCGQIIKEHNISCIA